MKQYLQLFLDESGNNQSSFFVIGGFYLLANNSEWIEATKSKLKSKILKTEKAIKKYRQVFEPNAIQFKRTGVNDLEVKWNKLSDQNKIFLFQQLKEYGQFNTFMIANLTKWTAIKELTNTIYIYNLSVYIMLERIIKIHQLTEAKIVINIDQRSDKPDKDKNSLETYLNTTLFAHGFYQFKVGVKSFHSTTNEWIRYADYCCGMIQSTAKCQAKKANQWDKIANKLYFISHQKIKCRCDCVSHKVCSVVNDLCQNCQIIQNDLTEIPSQFCQLIK